MIGVNAVRGLCRWASRGQTLALLLALLGCGPPTARHGLLAVADSLGVSLKDPACATPRPDGTRQCRRIVADGTILLTESATGRYRVQRLWSFPDEPSWQHIRDSLEAALGAVDAVPFSCEAVDTQPLPRYVVSRAWWHRPPYVALVMAVQVPGAHGGYRVILDLLEPEEIPCPELPEE